MRLGEGADPVHAQKPADAIERFDRVIAYFEKRYRDSKIKIYCAHSLAETMLYILGAVGGTQSASALDPTWSDAVFLKGFALVDLGRRAEAKMFFARALELSPSNSQYLGEMAETEKADRNWQKAYDLFSRAAAAAEFSSDGPQDDPVKVRWRTRGWRGMAFALIEMGRLDEAEKIFKDCLKADPNDQKAIQELQYIAQEKARAKGAGVS
jgi:tetratricopeptide (TPR) repeat protein